MRNKLIGTLNTYSKVLNIHIKNRNKQDIFIYSAPRSGSTWLMEMIASQKCIKFFSEPTNIREPYILKKMEVTTWDDLLPNPNREKIFEVFFDKLRSNKVKLYNPSPFRPYHHFLTDRIVFKMMYANDMMDWLEKKYNGQTVFLIRHPIPVTLSRQVLPVLPHFLKNETYMEVYFTKEERILAEEIVSNGTHLEKGTLDWVLQNAPPLKLINNKNWLFFTYEELVINTAHCINLLCKKLNLPDPEKITRMSKKASKTAKTMSDMETLNYLKADVEKKRQEYLIGKWKTKISNEEETRVFEIISAFGVDIYKKDNLTPDKKYLNFPELME